MKTGKGTPRKTTIRNEPAMKKQPKDAAISKNEGGSPRKNTNEAGKVCNKSTEKGNNKKTHNTNKETT